MSIWLIITPALAWVVAGTIGVGLIRRSPDKLFRGMQPTSTQPRPYDPREPGHRFIIALARGQGWFLLAAAGFLTLMSVLVATGLVPPSAS